MRVLRPIAARILASADALGARAGASARSRTLTAAVLVLAGLVTVGLTAMEPLERGLTARFWTNPGWQGAPKLDVVDRRVDLGRWQRHFPDTTTGYSARWEGAFNVPVGGRHRFRLTSSDGVALWIDDAFVVRHERVGAVKTVRKAVELDAGYHRVRIRYFQVSGPERLVVEWARPGRDFEPFDHAVTFVEAPTSPSQLGLYWARAVTLPALLVGWCLLGTVVMLGAWPIGSVGGPPRRTPLYAKLAILLALVGFVADVLASLYSDKEVLGFARLLVTTPIYDNFDSWTPIWYALQYFEKPDASLTTLLHGHGVKFQYPLTSLLFFLPVRSMGHGAFIQLMNLISWIGVLVSVPFLAGVLSSSLRRFAGADAATRGQQATALLLAAGFTVTFYPIGLSYFLGQVQTLLYVGFLVALWAWLEDRKLLAGVLVGLVAMIKPQLGLLLIWGLLRREWRFCQGIVAVTAVFGGTALALYGWDNNLEYLRVLSHLGARGESFFMNQSLGGLLHRVLFNGPWNLHNTANAFPPYHPWVDWASKVFALALIVSALAVGVRGDARARSIGFSIAALSFTMASPIAWVHHYAFALPIYAVALAWILGAAGPRTGRLALLASSFVLMTNYYAFTDYLAASRWNVLQSCVFFGALLLVGVLYDVRRTIPDRR